MKRNEATDGILAKRFGKDPLTALATVDGGEWFTAHGVGENLDHVLPDESKGNL